MLWSIYLKSPFGMWHEPGYGSLSAWQFIQNTLVVGVRLAVWLASCSVPAYYAFSTGGLTRVVLALVGAAVTLMFLTHCVKAVWSRVD